MTGSHRYAAWKELGRSEKRIPTISLDDVIAEDNLTRQIPLDLQEYEKDYPNRRDLRKMLTESLSEQIREKYGIRLN